MKTPVIVKIKAHDPEMPRIREAAAACREGKIVAFPTETVYGLGGRMGVPGIVKRIREIKKRAEEKPFAYHIGDWEMLETLRVRGTPVLRFMAHHFWPGPVTLVIHDETGNKIGIRFPKNRIARMLINEIREPLIATSANRSGEPSPHTAQHVLEKLGESVDYLVDGGKTELASDSTVVDLTADAPVIIRKGYHSTDVERVVEKILTGKFPTKRILIVCTGNSCRSPMAEGLLKHELNSRGLSGVIEVASCGMNAREGIPASSEAEFVMRNRSIDISHHKSRPCQKGDFWTADLILAMSSQHATDIESLLPFAKGKTIVLDVPDPIGMRMGVYEATVMEIEKKLRINMDKITKLS